VDPELQKESRMADQQEKELFQAAALTREIREAFAEAVHDQELWTQARDDTQSFLRAREIEITSGATITFLDQVREGDWLKYLGAGAKSILEMYCPPTRTWWNECAKIARVCETRTVEVKGELVQIEVDCYFVCERFIWEEELTLPQRPPWPPIPLPHR
jgi:hypothetical protein